MGNIFSAFVSAVFFYYFKILNKIKSYFGDKGEYNSNSPNEGLLGDSRNFEKIDIQNNISRILDTKNSNTNAKNEYQLLKNSDDSDVKNAKNKEEFEELQKELKSMDLENEDERLEVNDTKEENMKITIGHNSQSPKKHSGKNDFGDEDNFDDLKAEILNKDYEEDNS